MSVLEIIILVAVLVLLFFGIIPCLILSYVIFSVLLVRNKPEKWGHTCSQPDDPEIVAIFDQGSAWREKYAASKTTAYIQNDGLELYGEYFDFGHKKAAIMLPGRMESCIYACYFAETYRKAGYNVLVADARAHGLSQGKYNCVGHKEYRDILAWGKWLHHEAGNDSVVLHGVCIGANTSMLALTSADCPDYFRGMVCEGMFKSFYESTKNHMKADKRPIFPFFYMLMFWVTVILRINVITDGPYKRIKQLKKPVLFIHGRQDKFSLPVEMEKMYAQCTAPKQLVWFDKGAHSRLRINNVEAYDQAVTNYLATLD